MKSREVGQQLFVRWSQTVFVALIAALSGCCSALPHSPHRLSELKLASALKTSRPRFSSVRRHASPRSAARRAGPRAGS